MPARDDKSFCNGETELVDVTDALESVSSAASSKIVIYFAFFLRVFFLGRGAAPELDTNIAFETKSAVS